MAGSFEGRELVVRRHTFLVLRRYADGGHIAGKDSERLSFNVAGLVLK
jgi:hypothetical protein